MLKNKSLHLPISSLIIFLICSSIPQSKCFQMEVKQPTPFNKQGTKIFVNSTLTRQYDDTQFNQVSTCKCGELALLQFSKVRQNYTIQILYSDIQLEDEMVLNKLFDIPSLEYKKVQASTNTLTFEVQCQGNKTNKQTYFNKFTVTLKQKLTKNPIEFTFLVGCDKGGRNKKFQIGYIIIMIINAAITIGVALHSKIWSIRIQNRLLSIELKWYRFLIMIVIVYLLILVLYIYASEQFNGSNKILGYLGIVVAYIFTFICVDEIFFLVRKLKKEIFKAIRLCDVMSFVVSTAMFIAAFFSSNWVYNDVLAIAVCVGSIKLFRFSSMKQAVISMSISVIFISIASIFFHYNLDRSYNDYASQMSSPLFIQIPDMIDELYKKCSWLPVLDVIIPGVFLSLLRTYDENYNTGWGGVYTLIGNLFFVASTVLWVMVQAIYPYSIPFCCVTYPSLIIGVLVVSLKRNQLKILWGGLFNGANNELSTSLLRFSKEQEKIRFSHLINEDILFSARVDNSELSVEDDEENQKGESNLGSLLTHQQ